MNCHRDRESPEKWLLVDNLTPDKMVFDRLESFVTQFGVEVGKTLSYAYR